jgi:hypothetical protein
MKLTSEQIHEIAELCYNDMCEAIEIVVNDVAPDYKDTCPNIAEDPKGWGDWDREDTVNTNQILKAIADLIQVKLAL